MKCNNQLNSLVPLCEKCFIEEMENGSFDYLNESGSFKPGQQISKQNQKGFILDEGIPLYPGSGPFYKVRWDDGRESIEPEKNLQRCNDPNDLIKEVL